MIFCSPTPALENWLHWEKLPKHTLTKRSASTSKGFCSVCKRRFRCFRTGGSIILNASIAASKGVEASSVYNATKASRTVVRSHLDGRSETTQDPRQRHQSWSDRHTGLQCLAKSEEQIEQMKTSLVATVPMGRMGSPDEVAKAASFLASMTAVMSPASNCS